MKAYFIPGMAADKRVFLHIQLPAGFEPVYLDWLPPNREESLPAYAMRLAKHIDTTQPFVLIGLSFGGMLAIEIAKQYPCAATILISSIPLSAHLPRYFRMAAKLRLHKYVPIALIKAGAKAKRLITREQSEDKKMLLQIIDESDNNLVRWSMYAILNWQNETLPPQVWHIHGAGDGVLPIRFTQPTHVIPNGGHMMVMTSAADINQILARLLPLQK
jgi:pimeloyl-ACP methyl ester carboxylesterase